MTLRFKVRQDEVNWLFPEGVNASAIAVQGMQRDQDYCDSVHAAGAIDEALARAWALNGDVTDAR